MDLLTEQSEQAIIFVELQQNSLLRRPLAWGLSGNLQRVPADSEGVVNSSSASRAISNRAYDCKRVQNVEGARILLPAAQCLHPGHPPRLGAQPGLGEPLTEQSRDASASSSPKGSGHVYC